MSAPDAAAVILWIGVTLYAVFGGADFGAGIWDLLARGERGQEARAVVTRSLTPVWEANHVWLIFCLVVLWTAFSQAFAAIMTTLFIPLCLAALGIVLRGAGFAFRNVIEGETAQRAATLSFAASSLLTPFFMGTVVGAIATGRVPADGGGDLISSWLAFAPLAIGSLFVATSAFLAAVFLSVDSELHPLRGYFIRRALAAALLAGVAALLGMLAIRVEGEYLFSRLTAEASALVAVSVLAGTSATAVLIVALRRGHRSLRPVRPLAVTAVVAMIWAWGVAQYPYLLPTDLSLADSAAPAATLTVIFIVFAIAAVFILPALALLYILTQRGELGDED